MVMIQTPSAAASQAGAASASSTASEGPETFGQAHRRNSCLPPPCSSVAAMVRMDPKSPPRTVKSQGRNPRGGAPPRAGLPKIRRYLGGPRLGCLPLFAPQRPPRWTRKPPNETPPPPRPQAMLDASGEPRHRLNEMKERNDNL